MKSKRIGALTSLIGIALIYLILVVLKWDWQIPAAHLAGILGLLSIFGLSTLVMMSGANASAESKTQRFILGTSIQMILVLFFVLIVKYTWVEMFQEFVWYFMSFFIVMLFTQAIWMLVLVNKK